MPFTAPPNGPIADDKNISGSWLRWLVLEVLAYLTKGQSGTVTLSGGTKAVVLTRAEPDVAYQVLLTSNANETMRWASKTTTGFTITSSNGASTASVDYLCVRS